MATQKEVFRFYRSNLPTVVWDPNADRALAEFISGQFFTEDENVALVLRDKGYPQIPLDATEPPDVFFEKGKSLAVGEHAKILPPGITEEAALAKEKNTAMQAELAKRATQQLENKLRGTETQTKVNKSSLSPADIVKQASKNAGLTKSQKRKISRRKK